MQWLAMSDLQLWLQLQLFFQLWSLIDAYHINKVYEQLCTTIVSRTDAAHVERMVRKITWPTLPIRLIDDQPHHLKVNSKMSLSEPFQNNHFQSKTTKMETPIGKREISVPGIVMRPKAKRTLNNIIVLAVSTSWSCRLAGRWTRMHSIHSSNQQPRPGCVPIANATRILK